MGMRPEAVFLLVGAMLLVASCEPSGSLATSDGYATESALNPDEQRLLKYIPDAIRSTCRPLAKGVHDIVGALLVSRSALAGFDCEWLRRWPTSCRPATAWR